uniref:Dimer_Tnp_hAT domain-containing protein n=1 Tax=Panagrellus redivivus TaxID=6233 RepID=A0A7E4UU63_PANRE
MSKSKANMNVIPNVVRDMTRAHFANLFDDVRGICLSCDKQMCSKLDTIKKHYVRKHADVMRRVHGVDPELDCHVDPMNFGGFGAFAIENSDEKSDSSPPPPAKRAKTCNLTSQVNQIAEHSKAVLEAASISRSSTPSMAISTDVPIKIEQATYVENLQQQIEAVIKEKDLTVNEHVLALFASSNTPLDLVENRHFTALCNSIPNYIAPTITALNESISNLAASGPEFLRREVFAQHKPFSVVCGLNEHTSGYNLSINVHYYDSETAQVHNKLLDIIHHQEKPLTSSIMDTVICNLSAHGADLKYFVKLVFDGGANLAVPFLPSNSIDCRDITETATQTTTTHIPPAMIDEYANFLTHRANGGTIRYPRFYTCAANRLQAALEGVLEMNRATNELKETVFAFLITVARTPAIQTEIYNRTGKRIIFPCRTNWTVYNQAFGRIVELEDAIIDTCEAHGYEFLHHNEMDLLKEIVRIVLPVNEFITALENTPSGGISLLLGGLNGLLQLYEHMLAQSKLKVIKGLLISLNSGIRTRFEDVFASQVADSAVGDPMYAAACLLNPLVSRDFPSTSDSVKVNAIVRAFNLYCKPQPKAIETDSTISRKSIYGFSSPSFATNNANDTIRPNPIVAEAEAFIRARASDFGEIDAWKSWAGTYPRISKLAQLLFVIPGTSSSANTVLSYCAFMANGSNSDADLARKRVIVSYNSFQ